MLYIKTKLYEANVLFPGTYMYTLKLKPCYSKSYDLDEINKPGRMYFSNFKKFVSPQIILQNYLPE